METTISENSKNISALIHLSTFSKYFFPFGNFIAPLLLWSFNKDKVFINSNGKEALNFQISILLYAILIVLICIPFVIYYAADIFQILNNIDNETGYNSIRSLKSLARFLYIFPIAALLLFGLFVIELYAVISATIKASSGKLYHYPLSIPFIKTSNLPLDSEINQSKNEQLS